jgi:cardiolipin synthase (CMP-forming)
MPPWVNVANLFTALRLLAVPFIIQAILDGRHFFALALFAAAAFTDILDGAAARRFKLTTRTGAYFDPIADKCLLSGVFLALAAARLVPWWLVYVIFGRDLLILLGVATVMLLTDIRGFPPSIWGKLSTFVQILTAVVWLGRNALPFRVLDAISWFMLWPCAGFTIWSALHYTWRGVRMARAD